MKMKMKVNENMIKCLVHQVNWHLIIAGEGIILKMFDVILKMLILSP